MVKHTSRALNFQDTLLRTRILLEGVYQRCGDREEGPLGVCWRVGSGSGWRRGVDNALVAGPDGWAIGRRVE